MAEARSWRHGRCARGGSAVRRSACSRGASLRAPPELAVSSAAMFQIVISRCVAVEADEALVRRSETERECCVSTLGDSRATARLRLVSAWYEVCGMAR